MFVCFVFCFCFVLFLFLFCFVFVCLFVCLFVFLGCLFVCFNIGLNQKQGIAELLLVVDTLPRIYFSFSKIDPFPLKTQNATYICDVLYQSIPTYKVTFGVGEGLYKKETNLPLKPVLKCLEKNISRIIVTFKTWKSWIMVFKHLEKIFPRNNIQKRQCQIQRAVSSS